MKKQPYRDNYYDDNYDDSTEYSSSIQQNDNYIDNDVKKKSVKKRSVWSIVSKITLVVLLLVLLLFVITWIMSLFVPKTTNILIMATDEEGTRTDTIMLASYDKNSDKLSLVSIPRDTYVTVSDETYSIMCESYPQPSSKNMKINAVHHFGGVEHGVRLLKDEVSSLLNIKIDYYVKVDFDAFRYIIDSIGGIDFYVPMDMKYSDPVQNLYIDLKEGQQILDGEKAEHVLRFRSGYANADLGRISVQQDFMKAFISQTLSKGTILSNPMVYINAMFKYDYVETDFGVADIMSYAPLVGGIDMNNVDTHTLPGYPDMIGGQSYYVPKSNDIEDLLYEIGCN